MSGPFKKYGPALVANGYQIIPIPLGSKGPILKNWRERYPKSSDEATAMGERHNKDGVGILTTWTPAIDIDCLDESVSQQMEQFVRDNLDDAPLRIGKWPKRLMLFSTSKPFTKVTSAFFIDPANATKPDGMPLKQRIEVLGDGQQFVAYHVHPETGKPYTWPDDWQNPLDVEVLDLPSLSEAHAQAVCREFERLCKSLGWQMVGQGNESNAGAANGELLAVATPPPETEAEIARVKAALACISPDCSREDYLIVLAGLKWTSWLCAEELALEWAESSKEGKFDEKDFDRDWKSFVPDRGVRTKTLASIVRLAKAGGWDASRPAEATEEERTAAYEEICLLIDALQLDDRESRKALITKLAEMKLDSLDATELIKKAAKAMKVSERDVRRAITEAKAKSREHGEPTHANYAKALIRKMEVDGSVEPVGVEGKLWVYDQSERIWTGRIPTEYEVEVAKEFDGLENCSRRNDYLAIANHAHSIASIGREEFFAEAPVGLACERRFYSVEDGQITKVELAQYHRQRVVSSVIPRVSETPLWDRLMSMAFEGDVAREQEILIEEYIGACMLGVAHKFEKVLFMKGVGRAGKGTILKVVSAILPKSAISSISPDLWSREYYLAGLAGKRLNVVGELSDEIPIDAAAFKRVTGRDELTARHPTHRPFQFRNTAGHVFNANNFVFTKDHSEAFYDRWIFVEFRNSLIGKSDEIDTAMAEKIIESELPGVAARMLKGAKRLMERGHFVLTGPHEKLVAQWRHRSSTLMEFIYDREVCIIGEFPTVELHRAFFYKAYSDWCRESNRKPLGKQKLYDEMEAPVIQKLGIRFAVKAGNSLLIRGLTLRTLSFDAELSDDL